MNLTEAAKRILRKAALLAGSHGRGSAHAEHLFQALYEDESRGSEILREMGVSVETISDRWPSPDQYFESSIPEEPPYPLDIELESVLQQAQHIALQAGRDTEVGSEHLLFGLVASDTSISEILLDWNLTPESVSPGVAAIGGVETASIPVEEALLTAETGPSDRADAWRIVDAAANRASEGWRVIEDVIRFGRNDPLSTRLLKELRHELNQLLAGLPATHRLAMRETSRDVGTSITTRSESSRSSIGDLLSANFKRTQEALRSLEEASKCLGPDLIEFSRSVEAVRYRSYDLERLVLRTLNPEPRLADAKLYLLLTRSLCKLDPHAVAEAAVVNGVDVIQLREKDLNDRQFLAYAGELREITRKHGALLIVNDRPDLAILCDADGVHLGQADLGVFEARKVLGPEKLIGVSTHHPTQAEQAIREGADYLGAGPIFPSETKDFDNRLAGLGYVEELQKNTTIPWFAIGGINEDNLTRVLEAGASRVAVCGAICGSSEPGYTAAKLSRTISESLAAEEE